MPKESSQNDNADDTRRAGSDARTVSADETSFARALEIDESFEVEDQDEIDFGRLLDQFEQERTTLEEGEIVRGTVLGLSERGVVIDFGYRSEGIVDPTELTENDQLTVKPGDEIEVVVKSVEDADGLAVLSRAGAVRRRAWAELEKAYLEGTSVKGRVVERIKGGLQVDVGGIAAFLPASQIDVRPVRNLDGLVNQVIDAKVIKLSSRGSTFVLSRKAFIEEEDNDRKYQMLQQLEVGMVIEGQIKNLTDFGAFVDIGGGIDGLLHVTEMSWGRPQHPNELFRVGDTIRVKVLRLDRERGRVSVGYKQLLPGSGQVVEDQSVTRIRTMNEAVAKPQRPNEETGPNADVADSESIVSKPDVDLFTEENSLVILIDLPGLRFEDLFVGFEGNVLRVNGDRTLSTKVQRNSYYLMERSQGRFSRSVQLPPNLDLKRFRVEFKNGLLRVTIPKLGEIAEPWEIKKERGRVDPNSEAYQREKAQLEARFPGHIVAYANGERIAVGRDVQELTENIPAEFQQSALYIKDIPEGPPIRFRRPFFIRHTE